MRAVLALDDGIRLHIHHVIHAPAEGVDRKNRLALRAREQEERVIKV